MGLSGPRAPGQPPRAQKARFRSAVFFFKHGKKLKCEIIKCSNVKIEP